VLCKNETGAKHTDKYFNTVFKNQRACCTDFYFSLFLARTLQTDVPSHLTQPNTGAFILLQIKIQTRDLDIKKQERY
jgi:hypothetical protein